MKNAAKETKDTVELNLILDNGDVVTLTYPEDEGEVFEELLNATKTGGLWFCGNAVNLTATYRGWRVDYINMSRVVAIQ